MAPKKKDPPSGQRSISTFFSPKPRVEEPKVGCGRAPASASFSVMVLWS